MGRRRRPSCSAYLLSFFLWLFLIGSSNALPLDVERPDLILPQNLDRRATSTLSALGSFQTVSTKDTPLGEMIQTCTITLTPIVVDGKPEVVEVESCTVTVKNTANTNRPSPSPPNQQPSSSAPSSSRITSPAAVATSTSTSTTTSSSATTSVSTSPPGGDSSDGSETADGALSVDGLSTVQGVSTPTQATANARPTVSRSPSNASGTSVPTAAAAAESPSSSSQNTFTLPGKKLSVLPIGLAVFAGISVIALIVVGLVTYERTKYRKAFRERKLAEAGSTGGYGGTSQI